MVRHEHFTKMVMNKWIEFMFKNIQSRHIVFFNWDFVPIQWPSCIQIGFVHELKYLRTNKKYAYCL